MPVSFNQRVGVFIDVQNMFYATKNLYSSKLNYSKLLDYIARGRDLVRAVAYVVQTPEIDQSNFLTMLRSNGYEVRSKELRLRPDGSCKGDWDMGLALDALSMAERLDVVAIVSGDGDFTDLVMHLKARGVRVEVYSFPYSTAEELRATATEFYQMGPEIVMNPTRAFSNPDARARGFRDDEYPTEPYREGSREGATRENSPRDYARDSPRDSRAAAPYARDGRAGTYGRDNYGRTDARSGAYGRDNYGQGQGQNYEEFSGPYREESREEYHEDGAAGFDRGASESPEVAASDQE